MINHIVNMYTCTFAHVPFLYILHLLCQDIVSKRYMCNHSNVKILI